MQVSILFHAGLIPAACHGWLSDCAAERVVTGWCPSCGGCFSDASKGQKRPYVEITSLINPHVAWALETPISMSILILARCSALSIFLFLPL